MAATKRIPVSEETWKELGKEKEPGQTWDELLRDLKIEKKKEELANNIREAKNGDMEGKPLDEL
jgi:predicted CopG family antitoxin